MNTTQQGGLLEAYDRAIAFAEMLDVLERLVAPFDSAGEWGGYEYGHKRENVIAARAAIAKAKGLK